MADNQPDIKTRASRIGLIVCAVMLVLSCGLTSTAGNDWLWYVISSVGAIPSIKIGPPRYRKIGVILLTLCAVLIITDIIAGHYLGTQRRENMARIEAQRAATNNIPAAR